MFRLGCPHGNKPPSYLFLNKLLQLPQVVTPLPHHMAVGTKWNNLYKKCLAQFLAPKRSLINSCFLWCPSFPRGKGPYPAPFPTLLRIKHNSIPQASMKNQPLIVLSGAGAVGHDHWPVKVFSIKARCMGGPPLENSLVSQQTLVAPLIRR